MFTNQAQEQPAAPAPIIQIRFFLVFGRFCVIFLRKEGFKLTKKKVSLILNYYCYIRNEFKIIYDFFI